MAIGRLLSPVEGTLGALWSLGEIAQAVLRPDELGRDPYRDALVDDLRARGFYPDIPADSIHLRPRRDGWLVGDNPHERVDGGRSQRVVAHLAAGRPGTRTLVVVCHCYGVPSPRVMSALFGLRAVDADVVTNIMPHHARGSFRGWPGAGFTSARTSTFIENLRAAVTGLRTLTMWLKARRSYERVVVLGFSIGGQLALHLANTGLVDRALLYCPVASLHRSATELGLMSLLHAPVSRLLARTGSSFSFEQLRLSEPLGYPLAIAERDLHVVVQQNDALAPPWQVALIRDRYPRVGWHELPGTHLFPAGRQRLHGLVRELLA